MNWIHGHKCIHNLISTLPCDDSEQQYRFLLEGSEACTWAQHPFNDATRQLQLNILGTHQILRNYGVCYIRLIGLHTCVILQYYQAYTVHTTYTDAGMIVCFNHTIVKNSIGIYLQAQFNQHQLQSFKNHLPHYRDYICYHKSLWHLLCTIVLLGVY